MGDSMFEENCEQGVRSELPQSASCLPKNSSRNRKSGDVFCLTSTETLTSELSQMAWAGRVKLQRSIFQGSM